MNLTIFAGADPRSKEDILTERSQAVYTAAVLLRSAYLQIDEAASVLGEQLHELREHQE